LQLATRYKHPTITSHIDEKGQVINKPKVIGEQNNETNGIVQKLKVNKESKHYTVKRSQPASIKFRVYNSKKNMNIIHIIEF
jgi:hypothetical protein